MPRIRYVGGVSPLPFFVCASRSNVVTNGNGTGTKNVLKRTLRFGLSLVSSLLSSRRYYGSGSKTILYLDTVSCKFLLYVSLEIDPFSCEPTSAVFSTQTNILYLGRPHLRYTEFDGLYQLFAIDTSSGYAIATYQLKPSYLLRVT